MLSVTRRAQDVAAKLWPPVVMRFQQTQEWARRNPQRALWVAGGILVVVLLILLIANWKPYSKHYQASAPIFALVAGLAIAGVTLMRHFAQTEADRQRRITESFSTAVEQLASEHIEVRLGGIYALERISQESSRDYWTVMEILTAFVRERTQRTEAERKPLKERVRERAYFLWEEAGRPEGRDEEIWNAAVVWEQQRGEAPTTDIAAVLTVIKRRRDEDRAREVWDKRVLSFEKAILRGADFREAPIERTNFFGSHLEGANFHEAHIEDAKFVLSHLHRTHFFAAHIEGADFTFAAGLTQQQIDFAIGNGDTVLSPSTGLTHPAHWTDPTRLPMALRAYLQGR